MAGAAAVAAASSTRRVVRARLLLLLLCARAAARRCDVDENRSSRGHRARRTSVCVLLFRKIF